MDSDLAVGNTETVAFLANGTNFDITNDTGNATFHALQGSTFHWDFSVDVGNISGVNYAEKNVTGGT